jgi:hypothetical protein
MKKRILAIFAGLLMAAGLTLVTAAPAQAYTWNCPDGTGCVYTGYSGNGSGVVLSVGQYGHGICHNFDPPFVNSISSVVESYGSDFDILLYPDPNCHSSSGVTGIFVSGECAATPQCTGNDDGAWNFNTISGLKFDNRMDSFLIRAEA